MVSNFAFASKEKEGKKGKKERKVEDVKEECARYLAKSLFQNDQETYTAIFTQKFNSNNFVESFRYYDIVGEESAEMALQKALDYLNENNEELTFFKQQILVHYLLATHSAQVKYWSDDLESDVRKTAKEMKTNFFISQEPQNEQELMRPHQPVQEEPPRAAVVRVVEEIQNVLVNQNNPTLKNLSSLLSPLFGNIKRDPERVRDHIKRKLNIGIEKFKRGEGPLNAFLNLFNNPVQAYQPSPTFSRVGIPLNNPEPACENPQPPKRQHDHSDSESEEGKGKKKIKEDLKD